MVVLIAEALPEEDLGLFSTAGLDAAYRPELEARREALLDALGGAAALVVRNRVRVDGALLDAGPGLRVVGRLGVGLDNIDLDAARRRGVAVVHAGDANATAVAEYVFAALLHFSRRLAGADGDVRAGRWSRLEWGGRELAGRTLGLVGCGRIGRRVARRAQAFEMRVLVADPALAAGDPELAALGARVASLDEVLENCDFLSLHVPLTPATRRLIGAGALARLRPGCVVVNAARGGVLDEAALADALHSGHLGGAALDVREVEPPPPEDPLRDCPRLLLTPHVAGLTADAQRRTVQRVAADVARVLAGQPPLFPA
jgi:D-3-phosphoglycerate dehydrogenase